MGQNYVSTEIKKDMLITEDMLKKNACWIDKETFITTLGFSEFPKGLLEAYSDMVTVDDIKDGGYLSCEYWKDKDCYVYEFNFEYDSIPVNQYFNNSIYNNMIKNISKSL